MSVASRSRPVFASTSPRTTPSRTPRRPDLLDPARNAPQAGTRPDGLQQRLETAGVNTLRPEVTVDDQGVITAATITQTAVEAFPTLRPHTLAIGSYDV